MVLLLPRLPAGQPGRPAGAEPCGVALAEVVRDDAKYALLIGINGYTHGDQLSPLSYAVNDANRLSESLKGAGYKVSVMTSDQTGPMQPTRANVVREFSELTNRVSVNDTFLFFFAGHGFSRSGKGSFLATMDTDLTAPEEGVDIQFSLKGDGKPLGKPVTLTVHHRPQTLSVDVSKVDELELAVQASRGRLGSPLQRGKAWWGRAILSQDSAPPTPGGGALPSAVYLSVLKPVRGHSLPGIARFPRGEIPNSLTTSSSPQNAPVFVLNSEYATFRATLGISPETQEKLSATFILEGDGKELKRFGPLDVNDQPIDTGEVSVHGVDQLKLRVEGLQPGNRGPRPAVLVRGCAWWGGARLTKATGSPATP